MSSSSSNETKGDSASDMLLSLNKLNYSITPDLNLVQARNTRIFHSSSQSYPLVANQQIKLYLSAGSELLDAKQSHLSFDVRFEADVKVARTHARAPNQLNNATGSPGHKPYHLDPRKIEFFINSGVGFFSRIELIASSGSVIDQVQDPMIVREIEKRLGSAVGNSVHVATEQKMRVGDHAMLESNDVSREMSGDDVFVAPKLLKVFKPDGTEETGAVIEVSRTKAVEQWATRGLKNNNLSATATGDPSETFDCKKFTADCFWHLDSVARFEFTRRFQIPLRDLSSFFDQNQFIPSQIASGLCIALTLADVSDPLSVTYDQGRGSRSGTAVRETQVVQANGSGTNVGPQADSVLDIMGYTGANVSLEPNNELVRPIRVDSNAIDVKVQSPTISNVFVLATTIQMSSAILRKLDALSASGKLKMSWMSHTSKETDISQDAILDGSTTIKPIIFSSQNCLRCVSFLQPNSVKATFNIHEQKARTLPPVFLRSHEYQCGTLSFGREGSTIGTSGRSDDFYPPIKEMLRSVKCASKVSNLKLDQILPRETRQWYDDGATCDSYSGRKAQLACNSSYYLVCDLVRSTEKGMSGLPLNLSRSLQLRLVGGMKDSPFVTRTRDTARKFPKAVEEPWEGWTSIVNTFRSEGVQFADTEYYRETSVNLRSVLTSVKYATILLNSVVVKE